METLVINKISEQINNMTIQEILDSIEQVVDYIITHTKDIDS